MGQQKSFSISFIAIVASLGGWLLLGLYHELVAPTSIVNSYYQSLSRERVALPVASSAERLARVAGDARGAEQCQALNHALHGFEDALKVAPSDRWSALRWAELSFAKIRAPACLNGVDDSATRQKLLEVVRFVAEPKDSGGELRIRAAALALLLGDRELAVSTLREALSARDDSAVRWALTQAQNTFPPEIIAAALPAQVDVQLQFFNQIERIVRMLQSNASNATEQLPAEWRDLEVAQIAAVENSPISGGAVDSKYLRQLVDGLLSLEHYALSERVRVAISEKLLAIAERERRSDRVIESFRMQAENSSLVQQVSVEQGRALLSPGPALGWGAIDRFNLSEKPLRITAALSKQCVPILIQLRWNGEPLRREEIDLIEVAIHGSNDNFLYSPLRENLQTLSYSIGDYSVFDIDLTSEDSHQSESVRFLSLSLSARGKGGKIVTALSPSNSIKVFGRCN